MQGYTTLPGQCRCTWKSCPVFAWSIGCSSHKGAEIAFVCRWNLYYWFLAIKVQAAAVFWNPKANNELQHQRDTRQFFLLLPFPCTSFYVSYPDSPLETCLSHTSYKYVLYPEIFLAFLNALVLKTLVVCQRWSKKELRGDSLKGNCWSKECKKHFYQRYVKLCHRRIGIERIMVCFIIKIKVCNNNRFLKKTNISYYYLIKIKMWLFDSFSGPFISTSDLRALFFLIYSQLFCWSPLNWLVLRIWYRTKWIGIYILLAC